MRVSILANGDPPTAELLQRLADESELLIATDGSVHAALRRGIRPDLVSGDFDSMVSDEARAALPPEAFVPTPDQNLGDLEKAIQLARARGASEIVITGAAGGRADHMLANFFLLLRYHNEVSLCILDERSVVRAFSGPDDQAAAWTLAAEVGDTISVLSPTGTARVSMSGVAWPLEDYRLPVGTRGVSNVAVCDRICGKVRGGAILVCHLFQRLPPLFGRATDERACAE